MTGPHNGGGGDGESVRIDGVPTCPSGRCGGTGDGDGSGPPAPDIGEKDESSPQPKVIPGRLQTNDCMSREQIARVVRGRRAEIRACYERELQRNRELAGQIKVNFKINSTGAVFVALVKSSTLNDPRVEACVTRKIQRWQFPPPQKCSLVNVNYPFNFRR